MTVDNRFLTGSPYATYANYTDPIAGGNRDSNQYLLQRPVVNGAPTRGGYEVPPHEDDVNWGTSAKLVWDLGNDINLTAIGAYRSLHDVHTYDTQDLPLAVEMTENNITENYVNSEVRLAGKSKIVDWVGGLFYFDGNGVQHASDNQVALGSLHYIYTTYAPDTKAAFINATIRPFDDKLSFVLGARYSKDKKEVNFSNVLDVPNSPNNIRFNVEPRRARRAGRRASITR